MTNEHHKIGILAYGSLITNPGDEIAELEIDRIECLTPFKVEYARISVSRNNAPTLIPIDDAVKGKRVKAKLIVLNNKVTLQEATSILWRRECNKTDRSKTYKCSSKPTSKHVLIHELDNFQGIEKVIYTSFIIQEEYKNLNPEELANFAIESIMSEAGNREMDGIRYLLSAKKSGIRTELSDDYEKLILKKTETTCLIEAIRKLDGKRELNTNE